MLATRNLIAACASALALAFASGAGNAQTFGFAAMQPGTINHTTSSAIAKVLKEKGGLNTLVQATAGESVMIAIVGRGEADFAMANAPELGIALANNGQPDLRMIGPVYTLKTGFWVRKDSNMHTVADLQRQTRDHGLFRHARARSDVARHPRDRRSQRERHQAGAGPERHALGG